MEPRDLGFELDPEFVRLAAEAYTDALLSGSNAWQAVAPTTVTGIEPDPVLEAFSGNLMGITDPLGQVVATVGNLLNSVWTTFSEYVLSGVRGFIDWLLQQLSPVLQAVADALTPVSENLLKLGDNVTGFVNAILRFPEWFPQWFSEHISKPISDALNALAQQIWSMLPGWLKDAISGIPTMLQNAANVLTNLVATLSNTLGGIAEQIWNLLPQWLKDAITAVQNAHNAIVTGLQEFWQDPVGFIQNAATTVWQELYKRLPPEAQKFIDGLVKVGEKFFNWVKETGLKLLEKAGAWLSEFADDPWGTLERTWEELQNTIGKKVAPFITEKVIPFLKNVYDKIVEMMPDWLKDAFRRVKEGITAFIKDPLKFMEENVLKPAGNWLSSAIMGLYSGLTSGLASAIMGLYSGLTSAFAAPVAGVVNALAGVGQTVHNLVAGAFRALKNWVEENVSGPVLGAIGDIVNFCKTCVQAAFEPLKGFFEDLMGGLAEAIEGNVLPGLLGVPVEGRQMGERETIGRALMAISIPTVGYSFSLALWPAFFGFLSHISKLVADQFEHAIKAGIRLRPLGLGVDIDLTVPAKAMLSVWRALNSQLYRASIEFRELLAVFLAGNVLTTQRSLMQPMEYIFRSVWRWWLDTMGLGDVPINMPDPVFAQAMVQRLLPTTWAPHLMEKVANSWKFYGYPQWWYFYHYSNTVEIAKDISTYLAEQLKTETEGGAEKAVTYVEKAVPYANVTVKIPVLNPPPKYVLVTDRFGSKRRFPTSPFFPIPSIDTLAAMMVRDLFADINEYKKVVALHGVHPDIATLSYFFHFRYPDARYLLSFIWRALAGFAWFTPTEEVFEDAKSEALKLGLPQAYVDKMKKPVDLNFDFSTLVKAMSRYMKWYDFAPFPWVEGFTSDAWVMADVLARLPTRVEVRWLIRWNIVGLLSEKGFTPQSGIWEFTKILDDRAENPKVQMDLTHAVRLFQAMGMHPAVAPLLALAEAANSILPERTLLRTGFINLYRYNAIDIETLEKFMGNLVTASFKVAYLDFKSGKWITDKYINYPVQYTPPQRRILALRALMDRATRVLSTAERQVIYAFYDALIDAAKAVSDMTSSLKAIAEPFAKASELISGTRVQLSYDAEFFKAMLDALAPVREARTLRRLRNLANRIAGWLVYRVATGYFTPEEVKSLADALATVGRLTPEERSALYKVFDAAAELERKETKREYIPTPSMLATISEYLPIARKYFDSVVKAKGVPEEWVPLWRQYVALRPIVDEVNRVVTETLYLFYYFIIDEKTLEQFLNTLVRFGFEVDEIGLIKDRANARRWRQAWRELVGTPRQLVTMAEYVPEARKLALAEVKKRIDALPIPDQDKQFLYKLWEDYIRIRPVYDQVESEITELINDYARGVIDDEFLDWALSELSKWGIDEYEAQAIRFIAQMRRIRYERSSSS